VVRVISGAFLLVVGLVLAIAPAQAGSWISSPSGVSQGTATEIRGGEFPVSEKVVLEVADPSGYATLHVVQADAQGNISFEFQLDQSGEYLVKAWSSAGPIPGESPLAEAIVAALGAPVAQ
jgi:hypothetical protein